MMRCAVLDDYQGVALALADWGSLAPRVEVRAVPVPLRGPEEVGREVGDCDILVAMRERTRLDAAALDRLGRLRLIVTTGMRNAAIDLEAARERGIVVCGTEGRGEPTVELTWALILALARHLADEDLCRRGVTPWQRTVGADMAGRRLGVVGLGRIGTGVARVGLAFGMEVTAWSPHLTPERAQAVGVTPAPSLDALMATSDVVTLHLVLGEGTRGLVGARELSLMRPTALLVNTARAGLVDVGALVDALRRGRIAGAALDVFEREPLAPDDPLLTLDNVLLTPHLGYVTEGTYRLFYSQAVEDIAAFLDGRPVRRLA
ncbi:MAG: D-2-hydroxyacid dehydrogenase family protein [Firmicutes bacterium]|nr:D-2-hydroxyacid dehydrogenase family protein [Bacillota bacterium]